MVGGDVVVAGGGLLGTALAYELAGLGAEVMLVDRHDIGRATDAGAGILSPETSQRTDATWLALAQAARAHYDELAQRLAAAGVTDSGFSVCGLLSVVWAEHEAPWFEALVASAAERHPGLLVELSPAEAQERFPPLARPWRALFNPVAGRVDGARLNRALWGQAEAAGVRRLAAGVVGVEAAGGRVSAVATTAGRLPCAALAVTGGAWSAELGRALGAPLPVVPLKGQIVHLVLPGADSTAWPIVQPLLGFYLVPWPGGRVACGGTMEAEAGFDTRPTAAGLRDLLREALKTAPGLDQADVAEVRVGLRPAVMADHRPLLGRLPGWENAYVATGHGTDGLLLGPYSGRLVAAEIAGAPQPLLASFSAARFDA